MRVVTTLPSATEIVSALGIEPVGVSHECDHPPGIRTKPSVTRSQIDADASSGEIDRQVLEAEGGAFDVDVGTLDRVEPDLIVTQGICEVCAVDEVVVERAVERIDADPEVLTTDPHTVADVLADVERIGAATGRIERARELRAGLEARLDALRERTATVPERERPRAAVLDWTNPVMVAGHWVPELVAAAGGDYGMADPGDPSRPREWDEIRAYDPDVLVVAPCGFDLAGTAANRADLTGRDGWDDLAAVREGRVRAMDGDRYLNRPGPRIVDAAEYLAGIVHPRKFEAPPADVAVPFAELERRVG